MSSEPEGRASMKSVIEQARTEGEYACGKCSYELLKVPLKEDLSIVCPECGYEMIFNVRVQLRPRDPEYDREIRGRLYRLERLVLPVTLMLIAAALGGAFVVYVLTH